MMTRVLPVPAPAITSSGPCRCSTAARCAAFRVSGGVEDVMRGFLHLSRAARHRQGPRGCHSEAGGRGISIAALAAIEILRFAQDDRRPRADYALRLRSLRQTQGL